MAELAYSVEAGPPVAANVIRRALKRLRWSQNELARQAGTSSGNMSRYMHGDLTPSLSMAIRFEELTGCPPRLWLKRS